MNASFYSPSGSTRTEADRCIVCAGTTEHYSYQIRSTQQHCTVNVPEAWQLFYTDYPEGCPTQQERQYAFKIYALSEAVRAEFQTVVWIDTAFQPIGSFSPLWAELERSGWWVPQQGDSVLGSWCTDSVLQIFGLSRDEAMTIPLCYSGLVALRMDMPIGQEIWRQWQELYLLGTFNGPHKHVEGGEFKPWGNKTEGHCSDDPRCQGHRHDESALTFILHRLGLRPSTKPFLTVQGEGGFIGHHVRLVVN